MCRDGLPRTSPRCPVSAVKILDMDAQSPHPVTLDRLVHGETLRLGGPRDVARALGVVEPHRERLPPFQGLQADLGLRPAQRTRYAAQVELVVRFFFASHWPTP